LQERGVGPSAQEGGDEEGLEQQQQQQQQHTPAYWTEVLPLALPNVEDHIQEELLSLSRYGLELPLPSALLAEVESFTEWESNPIQLDRGATYSRRVQGPTSERHQDDIRAYLGFVSKGFGREEEELSLSAYAEPKVFLVYISFLRVSVLWGLNYLG